MPVVVSKTVIAGGIPWSAERPLSWSDFGGTPQVSSPAGAVTFYVMNYQSECTADVFSFKVWTSFLPRRSWVKSALLMEPYQGSLALQHEQTHFDISEVHARKLRRSLRELEQPCDRPEHEVNAVVERLMALDGEIQRRYDRETAHGSSRREQAQWDADVRAELRALEKYAQ